MWDSCSLKAESLKGVLITKNKLIFLWKEVEVSVSNAVVKDNRTFTCCCTWFRGTRFPTHCIIHTTSSVCTLAAFIVCVCVSTSCVLSFVCFAWHCVRGQYLFMFLRALFLVNIYIYFFIYLKKVRGKKKDILYIINKRVISLIKGTKVNWGQQINLPRVSIFFKRRKSKNGPLTLRFHL